AGRRDVVVLGLPRGGVPVAFEVAARLDAPLDVLVVRKLGVPGYEELAMGAIASGGLIVRDVHMIAQLGITDEQLRATIARERGEIERRERLFRGAREPLDVTGRIVLVVDDGLATGSSMIAAIGALRTRAPGRVVIAVPVASSEVCQAMRTHVDEAICLMTP